MAPLFFDSLDHSATADLTAKWTSTTPNTNVTVTIGAFGRDGTNGLRARATAATGTTSAGDCAASVTLAPVSASAGVWGFDFNLAEGDFSDISVGSGKGAYLCQVMETAIAHLTLRLNADGTLSVLKGHLNGTVLGTTTFALTKAIWQTVEFQWAISDTVGNYQVWVNGVSKLTGTGSDDTRNGGTGVWNACTLGTFDTDTAVTFAYHFDNVGGLDTSGSSPYNTALGPIVIQSVLADADGGNNDWTPSTGIVHYAMVDEATPNTTDYLSSSTIGQRDSWAYAAIPTTYGGNILATQLNLYAKKDDTGTRSIRDVVRTGSVNYDGSVDSALTTAWKYHRFIRTVDPSTSVAYTPAGINAAEQGVKLTA